MLTGNTKLKNLVADLSGTKQLAQSRNAKDVIR